MIPRRGEAIRDALEDRVPVVADLARLSVHEVRRANDLAAERLADRLVTETHAEDRGVARECAYDIDADTRLRGRARPGRDDDVRRRHDGDLFERHLVIAHDARLGVQLAKVLHDVVSEGVVVVDY